MAGGTPEDRRFAGTVDRLGVAALLLLVSRVLADPLLVNHDCGALLFAGGWLLEGKRPFLDYYLLNPPLIDYLQVVPNLLSRVARIPVPFAFNLIVLATVGLSWWLIRRLLRGSGLVTASTAAAVALAPLLVSHATYTQLWTNFDFGQREHFFILLALPYVVLRWLRWEDRPIPLALALAVGFGAGLFGSLKPHFLAVLLAPEAVWLARHRQPRRLLTAETIAAAAFVLLYAAHFAFLPGPMREAFFHRWVPMIWSGYGAYDAPLASLLSDHRLVLALATATLPLLLRRAEPSDAWRLAVPLSAMTIGGALVFLAQHKGWSYHAIPATGAAMALGLLVLADTVEAGGRLRVAALAPLFAWGALALCLVLCLVAGSLLVAEGVRPRLASPYHQAIAAMSDPGDAVLFIDTNVVPQHPTLIQLGRRPASRYYGNVPTLPMLYRDVKGTNGPFPYRTEATMPTEERTLLRELGEDVQHFAPRLIFIPFRTTQGLPPGFTVLGWLETAGWTRQYLTDYQAAQPVGYFAVFTRRTAAAVDPPAPRPTTDPS